MHRQAGASVHLCDRQGTSPLLVAAKFGQAAAVEALIAAGADYERTSDSGLSPIDAALENGHAADRTGDHGTGSRQRAHANRSVVELGNLVTVYAVPYGIAGRLTQNRNKE